MREIRSVFASRSDYLVINNIRAAEAMKVGSPGPGQLHHLREPSCFSACHSQPGRREPIVPAPLARLHDEALFLHPLNGMVERAGAHLELALYSGGALK